MKSSALALALLLAASPSLFADDEHGKRGEKGGHHGDHKGRLEKVERDDDDRNERRVVAVVPANRVVIINNDVNRLESILATTQGTTVVFAQPTLIRVGNEANVLANRIVSNVVVIRNPNAISAARSLRTHIRQLRAAAARGDAAAVRLHAREALPFVVRIDGMV
jgi:hypothetical protein